MDPCRADIIVLLYLIHSIMCFVFEIGKKYLHCSCFHRFIFGFFNETERISIGIGVDHYLLTEK
jgi:hypothetical protein